MDGPKRRLVVLLTMHRSGSSLTANILQKLGMSLGPFELLGAAPSNPHGHFESVPFYTLNRKVQEWAFGFPDDLPTSPEARARFLQTQAAWPTGRTIPAGWLDEGERLVRALVESGSPSGFKDPRAALVWPFWRLVLQRIDNLEVVPAILLRSPHEIAMSLCARSEGYHPYWDALDLVGVHLTKIKAIADEWGGNLPVARFATPHFRADLQNLAAACGLPWDDEAVDQVYDHSCVHETPATIPHPAQELFDRLGGGDGLEIDAATNARRVAGDARRAETLVNGQLVDLRRQLVQQIDALRHAQDLFGEASRRAENWQARTERAERLLDDVQAELDQTRNAFELTSECLEESERNLIQTLECLVSIQERHARADDSPLSPWEAGSGSESVLAEMLQRFIETQDRLDHERMMTRRNLDGATEELREARGVIAHRDEQLGAALQRGEQLDVEVSELKYRLDRFESHMVIGAALRGRRRVKQIWLKLRHRDHAASFSSPGTPIS